MCCLHVLAVHHQLGSQKCTSSCGCWCFSLVPATEKTGSTICKELLCGQVKNGDCPLSSICGLMVLYLFLFFSLLLISVPALLVSVLLLLFQRVRWPASTAGSGCYGIHPRLPPDTHCTLPLQRPLWMVGLQKDGPGHQMLLPPLAEGWGGGLVTLSQGGLHW